MSKFLISSDFRALQDLNMPVISVALAVLKRETSMDDALSQLKNKYSIFFALEVLNPAEVLNETRPFML